MRRVSSKACPLVVRTGCVLAASASVAAAQSIEPRAYSNAPVGVNFLLAGPYYTRGGLSFDTALPVTDPQLKTSNLVLGYARTLDLWGKSGKFDAIVPYTWLSGSASYRGEAVEREVDGFADPLFRLSVNLYGAPALTLTVPELIITTGSDPTPPNVVVPVPSLLNVPRFENVFAPTPP